MTVVPAQGGVSGSVKTQANTLAERFAERLGANHRLLHLPDGLRDLAPGSAAARELSRLPQVREALELLRSADVMLYGVGRAQTLAERRGLSLPEREELSRLGAVGEALGFYFDAQGRVVGPWRSLAIEEETLGHTNRAAVIAAGSGKAEAILAVLAHHPHALLVTDEGAASRIAGLLRL